MGGPSVRTTSGAVDGLRGGGGGGGGGNLLRHVKLCVKVCVYNMCMKVHQFTCKRMRMLNL